MVSFDKAAGCLLAGAAGDALGYAVEFLHLVSIRKEYGAAGITEYDLDHGKAIVSDDTQMTMYTANGLILGRIQEKAGKPRAMERCIWECYLDWMGTQYRPDAEEMMPCVSWLINVPEMNAWRAPGNTCLFALHNGTPGTMKRPLNNSKGCGGVMRVAPIGLAFPASDPASRDRADLLGAAAAAFTHGNPLGYMPAAVLVHLVQLLAGEQVSDIREAAEDSVTMLERLFDPSEERDRMVELLKQAIALAEAKTEEQEAFKILGRGWVGEEAIAVALFCALRYPDNLEKALIAAVNHSGDSDSTGSICGNILGAHLGLGKIPEKFLANLEMKEILLELTRDLVCPDPMDPNWEAKYRKVTYAGA